MIFLRASHTLMFVGGILLLAVLVSTEGGVIESYTKSALGEAGTTDEVELATPFSAADLPAAAAPGVIEEVDGWEDIGDEGAEAMQDLGPDPATPDNMGQDIFDPSADALLPVPETNELMESAEVT